MMICHKTQLTIKPTKQPILMNGHEHHIVIYTLNHNVFSRYVLQASAGVCELGNLHGIWNYALY